MKATLVYTITPSASVEQVGLALGGYRLDIAITEAVNISDKVFIFQREVSSSNTVEYLDTFYSVSSAGQLESVPDSPTQEVPFYRKNSLSLVFESSTEMDEGRETIEELLQLLVKAQNSVLANGTSSKVSIPVTALSRYWGLVAVASVTDEDLAVKGKDYVFDQNLAKTVRNDAGPRYAYVAFRADLPEISLLKVNAISVPFSVVTRNVANADGYVSSYRIYRTSSTFNAGTLTIETQ